MGMRKWPRTDASSMYVVSAVQRGGGPIPGRLSELSESRTARLAQGAQPWSYYGQDGVELVSHATLPYWQVSLPNSETGAQPLSMTNIRNTSPRTAALNRSSELDVLVVGGGLSGLGAALGLVRARRSVLVADAGHPRNAPAAHSHGYLTRDGAAPLELRKVGRLEVRDYGGTIIESAVTAPGRVPAARGHPPRVPSPDPPPGRGGGAARPVGQP